MRERLYTKCSEMDFIVMEPSPVSQNLYYYQLRLLVIRFKQFSCSIFACSDKKTEQFIAKSSLFLRNGAIKSPVSNYHLDLSRTKKTAQPAHPRCPLSVFAVRCAFLKIIYQNMWLLQMLTTPQMFYIKSNFCTKRL